MNTSTEGQTFSTGKAFIELDARERAAALFDDGNMRASWLARSTGSNPPGLRCRTSRRRQTMAAW